MITQTIVPLPEPLVRNNFRATWTYESWNPRDSIKQAAFTTSGNIQGPDKKWVEEKIHADAASAGHRAQIVSIEPVKD